MGNIIVKVLDLTAIVTVTYLKTVYEPSHEMSQLMRLWYLSHRRPAEPSLFAHIKYGRRQRVRPKVRHLAPTGWLHMRV